MKALYLLSLSVLLGCSQSIADQATKDVQQYLKENLNDPSSYEAIETLVSSYTRADSARDARDIIAQELQKNLTSESGNLTELVDESSRRLALHKKSLALLSIDDTTQIASRVSHQYRAKNGFGALMLQHTEFIVYPSHQVVVIKKLD